MVVDKCIGRCLDVGSTPTGSIKAFHSLVKFPKTLIYQRFYFCVLSSFAFHPDTKTDQIGLFRLADISIECLACFSIDS